VIFLCLFVMLTSFFESQTIADALGMMVGLLLLMTALISANFVEREPAYAVKLKLAAQLGLYALPLMAALFVLFPRVQGPLWGMPADAYASKTGLSDSMSPGSFGKVVESNEIVLRARFSGRLPAPAERYWRGPVFNDYDGHTWRGVRRWQDKPATLQIEPDLSSVLDYTVTQEASDRPWLLALEATPQAPREASSAGAALVLRDMQLVTQNPVRERIQFNLRSYTRYQVGRNEDVLRQQEWLELPPGFNPRTLALAAQWQNEAAADAHTDANVATSTSPINRQLIARALQYIRTEHFFYTLDAPPLGRNAVDEFLFDTRRGFCEHYAGAFVVLMRALDIPARVVTGYQGGEINPVDGYMVVRQRDAHAWVEVWLEDEGWVQVDPTAAVAPERIERGFQQTFDPAQDFTGALFNTSGSWVQRWQRLLRFNWEAVGNAWNQWVLGYGTEKQSSLLAGLGIPNIDWQTLTIALMLVFGLLLAGIGAQLLMRREQPEPLVRLYLKLCNQVARLAGTASGAATVHPTLKRQPHEGPSAYLERVKPSLPPDRRALVEQAFQIYEQARYARHDAATSAQLMQRLKTCMTDLRNY
jgi:transglutaminase-like putative cysteine protease